MTWIAGSMSEVSASAVAERAVETEPLANAMTDAEHTMPTDTEAEERGRLHRRRQTWLSRRRASSPSRGHERKSGSRYREEDRKHGRPSAPRTSVSPPKALPLQTKARRRSDAEPDHTFRGRPRNRSSSSGRTGSPILDAADDDDNEDDAARRRHFRRRSPPPSRHKVDGEDEEGRALRRERSYHKGYKMSRRQIV
ncbi:hypothetical protein ACEQ8H_002727 [Pleosporales sp. CAS-2024a]